MVAVGESRFRVLETSSRVSAIERKSESESKRVLAALEKVPEYVRVEEEEEEERERRVREKRSKVSMCNSLSSILGSLLFLCFQVDKNRNKENGFGSFKQRRKFGRENKRSRV